jgi:hypothetical protein
MRNGVLVFFSCTTGSIVVKDAAQNSFTYFAGRVAESA